MNIGRTISLTALAAAMMVSASAHASPPLDCKLHFNLSSWSVIYKHASGEGVIRCTDGQMMNVKITANGGGLTVGKSTVKDGVGDFNDLASIDDALGTYAQTEASAALGKAGEVQVMTKGQVSLSIAGTGKGLGAGVSLSGFKISRAN